MTGHDVLTPSPPASLLNRPMVLLLLATVGMFTSFYLLLSIVPLYAVATGSGDVGAGLTTGAMMLSTVLVELVVPQLLARFGYRAVMTLGLVLLGAPTAVLMGGPGLPVLLAVCLARGAGLGILVVGGTALVADLVPAQRRGEGLGLYGIAVGIPPIIGLPLGVWLSDRVGFTVLFAAAAGLALIALPAVLGLPAGRAEALPPAARGGVLGGLRSGAVARPALIFTATALATGVMVTFLALAMPADSRQVAAVALFVQTCLTPIARWAAGRFGDRHGSSRLLLPAALASAVGTAALVLTDQPIAIVVGMGLFGIGFGVAQNVTLALMFERVPRAEFGRVSALWNLGYDAGMGVGAVGFGFVVGPLGYSVAFGLTAAVLFAAVAPAWLDRVRNPERGSDDD